VKSKKVKKVKKNTIYDPEIIDMGNFKTTDEEYKQLMSEHSGK
jgi:hypothetical protein